MRDKPNPVPGATSTGSGEKVWDQETPDHIPPRLPSKSRSDRRPARCGPRFSKLNRRPETEILTKFDNVKSRVSWTAERRQKFQKMWDRGDKAHVIAAALGCKVGAVNVARARFGLKPRRVVSGRPKEPDEPAHKIERVAFTTSRLMEFCTEKELVAQTGHESYQWLRVIAKELADNGIDICEEAGVAPVIKVVIKTGKPGKPGRIVVEDNGPGILTETISGIIDYNIRISSREAYISPTRGRQGNALKSILPMAYVLGGKGETWIEFARPQASNLVHGQSNQAAADRQQYSHPIPSHDRDSRHAVLAEH